MVRLLSNIFERIKNGDEKAFDYIFDTYYTGLCIFANKYVEDIDLAEDIVQELFIKIWVKREQLNINDSLKSYLFQSVNNSCLNHLKHLKIRDNYKKEGLKHQEIAEKRKTSIKTVKVQIGKALKTLRHDLQDYLLVLLMFNVLS
jgi:RNA polymerase sigma-70 factor (ECF subfamily)